MLGTTSCQTTSSMDQKKQSCQADHSSTFFHRFPPVEGHRLYYMMNFQFFPTKDIFCSFTFDRSFQESTVAFCTDGELDPMYLRCINICLTKLRINKIILWLFLLQNHIKISSLNIKWNGNFWSWHLLSVLIIQTINPLRTTGVTGSGKRWLPNESPKKWTIRWTE